MTKINPIRLKQERVVEAVRHGFDGDAAVEFIHQNGYAIAPAGIARHLRIMGGRGRIQELIAAGKSNVEILAACFPDDDLSDFEPTPPSQGELFAEDEVAAVTIPFELPDAPLYETAKLTVRLPADLYEAIRIAARIENKPQNQLIVEILTSALSKMPYPSTE